MDVTVEETFLIDDFSDPQRASNGRHWQYVSDTVMGGVSQGSAEHRILGRQAALQMSGTVSLENNGGFIQIALDLGTSGETIDASAATGIAVCLRGDGETYAIKLRTADTQRPWQSYRSRVDSTKDWETHYLPFSEFIAHRIEQPLDCSKLRRIGLISIGDTGAKKVAMSRLALYREVRGQ